MSADEQVDRVLAVLSNPPPRRRKWPHGYGYERPDEPMEQWQRRIAEAILTALGLPVAEREATG